MLTGKRKLIFPLIYLQVALISKKSNITTNPTPRLADGAQNYATTVLFRPAPGVQRPCCTLCGWSWPRGPAPVGASHLKDVT